MTEEMKQALEAYLEGTSDAGQEKALKEFLKDSDCTDGELKAVKTMLCGSESLSQASFDAKAFRESCNAARLGGRGLYRYAGALAVVAALAVVVFTSVPSKQKVYGYDIDGRAIMNVDQAIDNMGSMNLLSELGSAMDEAESIINTLVGE